MNGEWFLWGGFIFSLLWHLSSWVLYMRVRYGEDSDLANVSFMVMNINFGLSGVALCSFGYLVF